MNKIEILWMNKSNLKIKIFCRNSFLVAVPLLALNFLSFYVNADPTRNYYSGGVFGGIGLMETRTARFSPDGSFEVGASFVNPYRNYFMSWQIFPWVEATFRYTDPPNSPHGLVARDQSQSRFFHNLINFSSGGTNLDRGFDIKFKLSSEGKYRPAIAIGFQDFIGTGLFEGEYIVASKKIGDFDFSVGLGWGRSGSKGNISNPFKILGTGFKTRTHSSGLGGNANFGQLFSGETVGLFGGVEYLTPVKGLTVKAEYNGAALNANRDVSEEFSHLRDSLPINVGVNYRISSWFDTSIAWERGNSIMLRFSLKANFNKKGVKKVTYTHPKVEGRKKVDNYITPSDVREEVGLPSVGGRANLTGIKPVVNENFDKNLKEEKIPPSSFISAAIMRDLTKYGFWGHSVYLKKYEAIVYLSNWPYNEGPKNIGLASKIIANWLPEEIGIITIVELVGSIEKSRVSILRQSLEKFDQGKISPEEVWISTEISQPLSGMKEVNKGFVNPLTYPSKGWWVSPKLKQHIGNPDHGVLIADVNFEIGGNYQPLPGLNFSAVVQTFVFGNLDKITRKSNSKLEHVRSDIVSYLKEGRNSLKTLQASYFQSLAPNWYGRVTAGIFEAMYGGIGAEVLFRPFGKKWALGAEINWVKQRDFNQLFRFRNYNTVTGHATLHYELPFYNMRAQVSAGRYLAGDKGVSFDVSRQFKSGVRVGAFATFTNVSMEDFGEGSFDKGFYIKIPLELLLTRNSKQSQIFAFKPLTRDGGQRVGVGPSLYEITNDRTLDDYRKNWDKFYENQ